MSGLECKNISKSYKDNKVLDNVSLNIEQGKIYGLIGRNGVGKTTLMSIMTGQTGRLGRRSEELRHRGPRLRDRAPRPTRLRRRNRAADARLERLRQEQQPAEHAARASVLHRHADGPLGRRAGRRRRDGPSREGALGPSLRHHRQHG